MAAVMEMMAAGDLDPPVHDRLPLKDASHAHQLLDDRAIMGKLVLVP
jgi:NADPH:quinone reductase-like Zn-dependent oxidoreductase